MNILLIENPAAGKRKKRAAQREAFHTRLKEGATVTRTQTGQKGDAYHQATAIPENQYDLVVCAGGDGTLHEVVTGLLTSPSCPPVGYLPSGTTNDFAYSLGLPMEPDDAAQAIMDGKIKRVDAGTVNGEPFVYLVSVGTLADVGFETSQTAKNRWGWPAYFLRGLRSLSRIAAHAAVIEHDGGCEKGEYVFCSVSNTKRIGGGMCLLPKQNELMKDSALLTLPLKQRS